MAFFFFFELKEIQEEQVVIFSFFIFKNNTWDKKTCNLFKT